MTNKIKDIGIGTIEYRMPNVVESMRLLSKLGVRPDGSVGEKSEFEMMADLIEHMKPFVIRIACKKDDVEISDWDSALNCVDFLKPLSEIGSEILAQFGDGKDKDQGKRRKKS